MSFNEFIEDGFKVHRHTDWHVQLERPDEVLIDCWRRKSGQLKWMTWGRTFEASPEYVLRAWRQGRLKKPAGAKQIPCRKCGAPTYLVTSSNGKRMAVSGDGGHHRSRCPEEAST